MGITVDESKIVGNDVYITYHIDTTKTLNQDLMEGSLLLTYLGGESIIDFRIHLESKVIETTQSVDEDPKTPKRVREKKAIKSYKVSLNKKAFDIDERAKISVHNHDVFPLKKIKVVEWDKDLQLTSDFLSVEESASFEVSLKKKAFDFMRPFRKSMERPIINKVIRMEITDEEGIHYEDIPLTFTNYLAPVVDGGIKTDKAYKKTTLQIQRIFVKYLIQRKKTSPKRSADNVRRSNGLSPNRHRP